MSKFQDASPFIFFEDVYVYWHLGTSTSSSNLLDYSITSLILSHFILNLRRNTDNHSTPASNQTVGTIRFAQSIEDGLGGPLINSWREEVDGYQERYEDLQSIEHSETRSTRQVDQIAQ